MVFPRRPRSKIQNVYTSIKSRTATAVASAKSQVRGPRDWPGQRAWVQCCWVSRAFRLGLFPSPATSEKEISNWRCAYSTLVSQIQIWKMNSQYSSIFYRSSLMHEICSDFNCGYHNLFFNTWSSIAWNVLKLAHSQRSAGQDAQKNQTSELGSESCDTGRPRLWTNEVTNYDCMTI